jgi:CDP-paratose 2-epimerase
VLFVDDAVEAYVRAAAGIGSVSGRAFNLGGGPANAVTLLNVLQAIEEATGREPEVTFDAWRPGDQRYFVADTRAVMGALGLPAPLGWREGIARLAHWLSAERPALAGAASPA